MRQFCELRSWRRDRADADRDPADYLAGYAEALADGHTDHGAATGD
ncbi:hypothetical protein H7J87_02060 [Mycolicibacterium wolinskyi]|nr:MULTISPECIES: hypothetical protein [Mycolicibacterium]MCV7284104.1 hypothetical protein [Mycolicibacterium wolinskyi]MCV7293940.1 hypothetical protein [Mycolicibacterium goodii]